MTQIKGQSTENKIGRRLRGGGRGSIVFQQDYAVLEHRRKFIGLKDFDYDELYPFT